MRKSFLYTLLVSIIFSFGLSLFYCYNDYIGVYSGEIWTYERLALEASQKNITKVDYFKFDGIIGYFSPSREQAVAVTKEGKKIVVYMFNNPRTVNEILVDPGMMRRGSFEEGWFWGRGSILSAIAISILLVVSLVEKKYNAR